MIDPPLVQTVRIDRWSIARPLATPARCPDSSLCQGLACPPGFSPSCRTWRVWARWRAPFRRFGQVRTSSGRVASGLGSHAVVEPQGDSEACGAMRRQHFVRHLPAESAACCNTVQHVAAPCNRKRCNRMRRPRHNNARASGFELRLLHHSGGLPAMTLR